GRTRGDKRLKTADKSVWSARQSAELYGIDEWGGGYFGVNDKGEVDIRAPGTEAQIPLTEIIDGLQQRGLDMPVLLRIENLVDSRISILNESFAEAIKSTGY